MSVLIIAAFTLMIAAFTLGRGRRNLAKAKRLVDYWVGLLVITVACLLPAFLLIWFVHSCLIPIPMGAEAVWRWAPDPVKHEENVENEEEGNIPEEHRKLFKDSGASEDEIRAIQELLWNGWPAIVLATLLLLLIGVQALAHNHCALLRDVDANEDCPPGSVDSYVGVQTLGSLRKYETAVLSGEEHEARFHLGRRRGNRSSHEIHQRDCLYERIAVASDDIAWDILFAITEWGPTHVIERLAGDLHQPGHHEISKLASAVAQRDDEVYEERGYVLIWNARRCYVSLAFAVEPAGTGSGFKY